MAKCSNDPENINFLRDQLTESGFEATEGQAELVLSRLSAQLEKLRSGKDLDFSDEELIES